jgi:hypothetical protein
MGKEHFSYLTEKQIRMCLANLREQGCIRRERKQELTIDRTSRFNINDRVYQYYLQIILAEHDNLAEFMLPSSGRF